MHENYQGIGLSRRLWNEAKTECLSNGNTGNFTVNSALNSESTYLSFGFKRVEGVRYREGMIDIPMLLQNAC